MKTSILATAVMEYRFAMCAVILVLMAVGMRPAAEAAEGWLEKRPVPIRRPLRAFDRRKIAGFRFVEDIGDGSADDVATEEYLEWRLVPTGSAFLDTEVAYLSVYYYTKTGDESTLLIPHTPEICYRQLGNQVTELGSMRVPMPGGDTIKAKYVRMSHPTDVANKDICVAYVFCVNGRFHDDREKARAHLALPWIRAVYFSKIERVTRVPEPHRLNEALEACKQILAAAVPELLQTHFPTRSDIDRARLR
ncbi:MAG: hypothetical protein O7B26_07175 [Planctomycetota bacterium]|nr:hypothetical protein [Planctomycetota bacterium]